MVQTSKDSGPPSKRDHPSEKRKTNTCVTIYHLYFPVATGGTNASLVGMIDSSPSRPYKSIASRQICSVSSSTTWFFGGGAAAALAPSSASASTATANRHTLAPISPGRTTRVSSDRVATKLTADHVAKERTVGIFVDLDGGFLFAHEERKVEQVLGRLAERGRVDDELQVGQARVAADFAEAFRDLVGGDRIGAKSAGITYSRVDFVRIETMRWKAAFRTHTCCHLARLVLILGDILSSELLESLSSHQARNKRTRPSVITHTEQTATPQNEKLTSSGRTCSASHWFLAR